MASAEASFLAAILLLAAASALIVTGGQAAEEPGQPAGSSCPTGMVDDLLSDNISPLEFQRLTTALVFDLSPPDAAQCVCDGVKSNGLDGGSSEAATSLVERTLEFFDVPVPDGFMCNVD